MMRKILSALVMAASLAVGCGAASAADCSGTIATGGTAQTVFSSGNVRGLLVMNNSANLMCISINGSPAAAGGTNCAAGSWVLQPGSATTAGGSFLAPPNITISALSIVSSTTGDRFSCERQ